MSTFPLITPEIPRPRQSVLVDAPAGREAAGGSEDGPMDGALTRITS